MANSDKMKKLITDCQKDIAAYLSPGSRITSEALLISLMNRLDGRQAKEALGAEWRGSLVHE